MLKRRKFWIWFLISAMIYFGMLLCSGAEIYGDSHQYIDMHIHREPFYPLFLLIFRLINAEHALLLASVVQNLFATFVTAYFVFYISETFKLKMIGDIIIYVITIAPIIVSPFFSSMSIMLISGVLSESLAIPLFLIFVVECHKMLNGKKKSIYYALGLAVLLSLIRNQFMVAILMWMFLLLGDFISKKMWKKTVIIILAVIVAFGAKGILVKSYNYVFNDNYINTTYGNVFILANILYCSDREDAVLFEDETIKYLYNAMFDVIDENEYNYSYMNGNIFDRADYMEDTHNPIKFDAIEGVLREYSRSIGIDSYFKQDIYADEVASEMMGPLLKDNFGIWVVNYLVLAFYGMVRSIAVDNLVLNIYTILMLALGIYHMIKGFKNKETRIKSWFMAIALLSLFGLSTGTALVTMCISRYVIYSFVPFYVASFLLVLELIRGKKLAKWLMEN